MGALFDGIRERITARDAAEFYGLTITRQNKALCPWHADSNPSLSFDRRTGRCRCFSCNNGGSAIDLVSAILGITPLQAAQRINADFRLGLDSSPAPPPIGKTKGQYRREYESWFRTEHARLYEIKNRMEAEINAFSPETLDHNPAFDEAMAAYVKVFDEINNLELMTFEDYMKQMEGG